MTLVSIVGDFYSSVLPVFYEFSDRITNHIIVYDDDRFDVQKAKKIIKGTKRFIKQNSLPITTYTKSINEDYEKSIEDIVLLALEISDKTEDVYINVTDGLASNAVVLASRYFDKGVHFLAYDRFDNEYNIISQDKMVWRKKMHKKMDIHTHFLLKDIEITQMGDKAEAQQLKKDLSILFQDFKGKKNEFLSEYPNCNEVIKNTNNGFLFEKYIFNLLSDLDHDDIAYGITIEDRHSETKGYKNEFDILIIKENHLHIIECKYKSFSHTKSAQEKSNIIYKLDSLRDIIDDDSRILLLTNESRYNYMDNPQGTPNTATSIKRARASNIVIRGSLVGKEADFRKDIKKLFGI